MKRIVLTLLIIVSFLGVRAQEEFRDKLFLGVISSYYLDFATSPLSTVNLSRDLGGGIITPDTAAPYQNVYLGLFSIGLDVRYNIHEFNENFALAVSAPVTIGFGEVRPQYDDITGVVGYGSVQVPVLAKFYLGTNATYKSDVDFGVSIGAGYEYNKISLFTTTSNQKLRDANEGWLMPVFSVGIHFWRGNSPLEVNFKYGRGPFTEYSRDRYSNPLSDGRRITSANSTKLSFIYLFDY